MSQHKNMVATAIKDAKQAFQDALDGKGEEDTPSPAINIDPDADVASSFFARQQPARLEIKEWIMILQHRQQQEGATTKDDNETTNVKQQVSQQQVDALYQKYFQDMLLNE